MKQLESGLTTKNQDDIIEHLLWTRVCPKHLRFMALNAPLNALPFIKQVFLKHLQVSVLF